MEHFWYVLIWLSIFTTFFSIGFIVLHCAAVITKGFINE